MYGLRHVLLPGILLIDGAYDAQGDADHGEDHSHDSLCSSVGEGRKTSAKTIQFFTRLVTTLAGKVKY